MNNTLPKSETPRLRIVGVHGVGNTFGTDITPHRLEERRALKSASWARNLTDGIGVAYEMIDLDFAYYSDKLTAGPVAQGTSAGRFLDDPFAQEILELWARELGLPDQVSQGYPTLPLRALSEWIAKRFDLAEGPLRVFIRMLCGEVASYLSSTDSPERIAARDEVASRISQHRPQVVIAHSLGSVVAYEALHAHQELAPELFLTLGSPLALPKAVFDRLLPTPVAHEADLRGLRMPGHTRWVNIADPGDFVAVPPQLGRFFDGIDQDHTQSINLFDFHKVSNYLGCKATAATIAPYLKT